MELDAVADLLDRFTFPPQTKVFPHPKSRCRWCEGKGWVWIHNKHWVCGKAECAQRQLKHAIEDTREDRDEHGSPWIYVPTPVGVELHEAREPNVFTGGAASGTKSYSARWHAYSWARRVQGYRVLLLRNTLKELELTHLPEMEKEQHVLGGCKYLKGERKMIWPALDSQITAGHCHDPRDWEIYLSTQWDEIVIDEASLMARRKLREIMTRARSEQGSFEVRERGGGWVRLYSNPGGASSLFVDQLFVSRRPDKRQIQEYHPEDFRFIHAVLEDNPYTEHGYERRLAILEPERYQQLRHGKWGVSPDSFFNKFKIETHVRSVTPR